MQEQYVTPEMLATFGITAKGEQLTSLLDKINVTVEERVGTEITESLSDVQLNELLRLQDAGDDTQFDAWITKNVPRYAEIVEDTIAITVGEVVENADDINQA
ncbi:MAG: DUF5663 domain-containing protein [Candidatus Saccharimonadales bacterium]